MSPHPDRNALRTEFERYRAEVRAQMNMQPIAQSESLIMVCQACAYDLQLAADRLNEIVTQSTDPGTGPLKKTENERRLIGLIPETEKLLAAYLGVEL